MKLQGIIFDLDGTLGDTLPVNFAAYRHVFEVFTGRTYTDREIEAMFGPDEEGIIRRLVPKPVEEFMPVFLGEYDRRHVECAEPFPGIDQALRRMKEKGIPMAVATGKGMGSLLISLKHMGIADYFETLEAGSAEGGIKPLSIRKILDRWGVPAESVAYVGDAPYDMEAAKEAGVIALAAAWAATAHSDRLLAKNPDALFRTVDEFVDWVENHLS